MCPLFSVSFTVVHLVTLLLKSKISLVNRRIKTQIFCKVGNTYGDITVYDSSIYTHAKYDLCMLETEIVFW